MTEICLNIWIWFDIEIMNQHVKSFLYYYLNNNTKNWPKTERMVNNNGIIITP